jgi:hypothetical protein
MKRIVLIFLIMSFAASLHALDWKSKNITVLETTKEKDVTTATLKDSEGNAFTVSYTELSDETADLILKRKDEFYRWKTMKINSIKFVAYRDRIEIAILPSTFSCSGTDIIPYLPAGMFFIYRDVLEYNFRITKDDLFVRIKGMWNTEEAICKKILEAIKDPLAYIRKRDPEYFLEKIEEFEKLRYGVLMLHNKGIFGGFNLIKASVIKRIVAMKKQNPKMTGDEIKKQLEKEGLSASSGEISLIINLYFNEFD